MDTFNTWFAAKNRSIAAYNALMDAVWTNASKNTIERLTQASEAAEAAEREAKAALDAQPKAA